MFYNKSISDNGTIILSEEIPNVRSVALGIWVGIGSRDEPEELGGMSHFLEHLVFKGTPTYNARQISETFDSLGAELNAFTAKETTCFYTRLLDEHLPKGFEVLADMLSNPSFKEQDILSERQVVLEEISLHEDSPDERIHDLFSNALFSDHPLGKPVLGRIDTVKNFSHKDIVSYYDSRYAPQNMVIAAAGSLKHNDLVKLVNRHFTNKRSSDFKRKSFAPVVESHLMAYKKKTEQAHICYGTEGLSANDKDRFIVSVLDNILGGGMSSRLFQEIREKRGLAYSVYSYHSVHTETGSFTLYAGTSPNKAKEVIAIMQDQLQLLVDEKVATEELNRAKQHLKGQLVLGLESTSHRMMRLGKSELAHGEILSVDELINRIDAVSQDDIQGIAKQLFVPSKMILTIVGPFDIEHFSSSEFVKQTTL
ncbi:MAG: insulinase family protein [Actinobacteria bacterium]|nr:MAG: insulinase family protein [Actinomycetota bacterium]